MNNLPKPKYSKFTALDKTTDEKFIIRLIQCNADGEITHIYGKPYTVYGNKIDNLEFFINDQPVEI